VVNKGLAMETDLAFECSYYPHSRVAVNDHQV